ncbi:COG3456 Predicted component of the type VI protein secretion system, contains a FHA domain [Rhabdaerophilaceae bacterium]
MQLVLKVVSSGLGFPEGPVEHRFGVSGGVVGRHPLCDWVLPDPSLTLSSRHAQISHNGLGFVITDTSTNGVYINQKDTPLGRGNSAPLKDGDLIYLAHVCLRVALAEALFSQDIDKQQSPSSRIPLSQISPLKQLMPLQPLAPSRDMSSASVPTASIDPVEMMRSRNRNRSNAPNLPARAVPTPLASASGAIPDDFDFLNSSGTLPPTTLLAPIAPIVTQAALPPLPGLHAPLPALAIETPKLSTPVEVAPFAPAELPGNTAETAHAAVLPTSAPDILRRHLAAIGIAPARAIARSGPDLAGLWSSLGVEAPNEPAIAAEDILKVLGRSVRTAIGVLAALPVQDSEGEQPRNPVDSLPTLVAEVLVGNEFAIDNHFMSLGDTVRRQQDATAQAWAGILASVIADLDPENLLARIRSDAPEANDLEAKALAWDGIAERVNTLQAALFPAALANLIPVETKVENAPDEEAPKPLGEQLSATEQDKVPPADAPIIPESFVIEDIGTIAPVDILGKAPKDQQVTHA